MTVEHVEQRRDYIKDGQASYRRWADSLVADEEGRRLYEHEAAKKDLWLQLVEARQQAGLTQAEVATRLGVSQAQVARMEKRGYDVSRSAKREPQTSVKCEPDTQA